MCRWGVFLSLVIFATHSAWADDAANPHPLSQAPSSLADPNAELVDRPLPGAKAGENGALSSPSGIGGEANTLTPFYVRTGVGLSFVTTVDYPDFGLSGDVPMQPGFATGLMLGAQFHDNIAFEIEGGLLYNSVYQNQLEGISASQMTQVTNIQLFQVPMMGNFVFRTDPLAGSMVRLVAGGGMGGIFRQVFITGGPNDNTRSQTLSAYQGFGGVQINPGEPDLMVDLQFRYLNSIAGQSVPSMSIMGTVTIRF
jgi:opacity protein-like surface antigen